MDDRLADVKSCSACNERIPPAEILNDDNSR